MKVYVVELWSDIHNCGYEQDKPMVFAKKEDADAYARSLFNQYYEEFKDDLQHIDDCHWLTRPDERMVGWSFNTDREDRFECDIYECEVK